MLAINCQAFANLANERYDTTRIHTLGTIRYCKTDMVKFNIRQLKHLPRCVLVSSGSDYSVTEQDTSLIPRNVIRWFSTNVMIDHPILESIPIGVVYSPVKFEALMKQRQQPRPVPKGLLYVCFTRYVKIIRHIRAGLYDPFSKFKWAFLRDCDGPSRISVEQFFQEVTEYPFVLSPPGAGPDCHRHWESMLLGSIPIMLKSPATKIFDDLPAWQISHWNEVTEVNMLKILPILTERFKSPAIQKLDMSFWVERIQSWAKK